MLDKEILVIGVGNTFRGDDGIGVYVASEIATRNVTGVAVQIHNGEGATLINSWDGYKRVFLVDAVAPNGIPGKIHRFEAHREPVGADLFHTSTHAFGVTDAIELARALEKLPEEITIFGIEGECFTEGVGLSTTVKAAGEQVLERILADIRCMPTTTLTPSN